MIAKEAAGRSCSMIVVNGQSADPATTTSMPFLDSTDGAHSTLVVEKGLVILRKMTVPTNLTGLVGQS